MKYSVLEKTVMQKIEDTLRDKAPGVMVRAYQGGRIICDVSVGNTYPYYDLASLTKIIFTTQAMMWAFELNKWTMDTLVSDIISWFPHRQVKVKDLLTHSSGLIWWLPIYQELNLNLSREDRRLQLQDILHNIKLQEHDQAVYSDIGFMTLGFVLEKLFDKNLLDIWTDVKNKFYLGTTLEFHPDNVVVNKSSLYAPTEECPWRKKLIQGEVHDENAWALGGVSTHAGLFGSIDDLSWFALHLRSQMLGIARYTIRQKTAQFFSKRAIPAEKGDWALGYMMPTPGVASCGHYFSLESVGHTGFTGTSMWYDPKMDMAVCILSNRVLYGRENKSFGQLRPQIHNWIIESYRKSSL